MPSDSDERALLLATARTLRALLRDLDGSGILPGVVEDLLNGLQDALKPFDADGGDPVNHYAEPAAFVPSDGQAIPPARIGEAPPVAVPPGTVVPSPDAK